MLYNEDRGLYAKFRAIEHMVIQDRCLHGKTIVSYPMIESDKKLFIELLNKTEKYYEPIENYRAGKKHFKRNRKKR
jgi:hypothetical protein